MSVVSPCCWVRCVLTPVSPSSVNALLYLDKTPPCNHNCPAGEYIVGYLALIKEGKYQEAWELIKQENPFPGVCGRVCPHPCESECNREELGGDHFLHSNSEFRECIVDLSRCLTSYRQNATYYKHMCPLHVRLLAPISHNVCLGDLLSICHDIWPQIAGMRFVAKRSYPLHVWLLSCTSFVSTSRSSHSCYTKVPQLLNVPNEQDTL